MVPFLPKVNALDVIQKKIHTLETLEKTIAVAKFKGEKIVFTNGCFDIMHRGHIQYLAQASDLGNFFIVAVNSDASVKRQGKSSSRPLQEELSRALILASLHFVNAVIVFDDDTPLQLIKQLKPDVLVKGADYDVNENITTSKKYIVGKDVVTASGGRVEAITFLEGYSTTAIEQKIKNSL
jgi:D-glycero-beta-D-manno-heptose 1-phosphate adenylyltransferase